MTSSFTVDYIPHRNDWLEFWFQLGAFWLLVVSCCGWWAVTEPRCCGDLLALRQIAKRTISTASRRQLKIRFQRNKSCFKRIMEIPVHLKGWGS